MTEEEIQNLKQKFGQMEADCQTKLDNIAAIATTASKKEEEINSSNAKLVELLVTSEASKNAISGLATEAVSLKTQLTDHNQKAADLLNSITNRSSELETRFDSFLKKPNDTEPSKLEKMSTVYKKFLQDADSANKVNAKLKEYESLLFGNKQAGTVGLKDRIEAYEMEAEKKKAEWEGAYAALFSKIEGLLPGATSTGLSKAYQDQHKEYVRPYWIWSSVFVGILLGMIYYAIATVHDATSISEAFMKIVSRAPFFVPAIWLAIFASRQQSQNRRLQEEYAHKETLSKSYESYKREIEKLPDSPDKLKLAERLMDGMVNMASDNPSHTLQLKHHNDSPPVFSELFRGNKEPKVDKQQ